ncbi:helix-hairpin-helix domain-containing protein [Streptomyces sp. NPDC047108]|uniref:helix-hairpin-helix domain-containing protein n=1 Tax=Streptomyces sp. NPDC047108 TaxID=3155025 RepID=UPI0033ED9442
MTTDRRADEPARTPDRPGDGQEGGDRPTGDQPVGDQPAAGQQDAASRADAPSGGAAEARPDGPEHPDPAAGAGSRADAGGRGGTADGEGGPGRPAAVDRLAAAVRAVESGERSAASFFAEAGRPARASTPGRASGPARAPAAGAGGQAAQGPGSTAPGPGGPGPAQGGGSPSDGMSGRPAPAAPHPAAAGLPPAERPARSATVREVLNAGGAPDALADKVLDVLGERAAQALREDPWQLLAVPGVRPEQADGFARALLGADCGPADDRRAQALVHWLLERAALEGHTALEPAALTSALAQRSVPDPETALRTAVADGGVLVFQDALDTPGSAPAQAASQDEEGEERPVQVLVGLDRFALAEESLADGLARLVNTFVPQAGSASGAEEAGASASSAAPSADAWQAAARSAPSPSAAELLQAVAGHGLVAHTGGEAARAEPAAVVAAARALGLRAYAAAHTEDGRRRLQELLDAVSAPAADGGLPGPERELEGAQEQSPGPAAVTVAGLLAGAEGPGRDADGALALDVLAVLDAPQLDVESAAMLVESLPDGARLVLSGDPGVLWSAGPGKVFADLLSARTCPQIASRTPDPGPIGELVSCIGIGELTEVEAPDKEVVIVPVRDAGEAVHRTVQLVADSVPRAIGVAADDTQVITPGHGGAAGTRALNAALKERLNPGPGRFGGFDPGDRVAYTPTPGRTLPCTVVTADAQGLHLDCAGAPLLVERERVSETVRHGWALTAHQAAGLRWPAAVVVLPGDAARTLTRSWVYTAFGRGERHLSVVQGTEGALPRAVAEVPVKERTTRLRALLRAGAPPAV